MHDALPPRRARSRKLRDEAGKALCSCGCGQTPVYPRRNWFSQACVDHWRERNDPAFIRQRVLKRDSGICAICGCDAIEEFKRIKEQFSEGHRRLRWFEHRANEDLRKQSGWRLSYHQVTPQLWPEAVKANGYLNHDKLEKLRNQEAARWCDLGKWTLSRHEGWDIDHIVPVVEGGGQCGLENLRTLCHPCHKQVTRELAARRRRSSASDS